MREGRYQITVDLEYKVKANVMYGSKEYIHEHVNQVTGIPLLQKVKSDVKDQKECWDKYMGKINFDKVCDHYMQTIRVCLVLDQKSADYQLAPKYKHIKCNLE